MKRTFSTIKICTVLAMLTLFMNGCLQPSPPTIDYRGVDVSFLSFQELKTKFNFSIDNPHPLPVDATLKYSISLNNKQFVNATTPVSVKAKERTNFALESNVSLPETFGMLQNMLEEIKNGKRSIPYSIKGTCKATIAGIPLETPLVASGELPLPIIPEIEVTNVSIASLDLSGASLVLKTNIANSNDFPLNLDSFMYTMRSEGKDLVQSSAGQIRVPARGKRTVDLSVKVRFSEFDAKFIEQIKNGSFRPEFRNDIKAIH